MNRLARAIAAAGGAGLVGAAVLMTATPARASCVLPARVSSYRFTGTVTSVEHGGRTATVRTDDGRTVTVNGGGGDRPEVVTSVDRTYEKGARYEFHPLNDASPYRDNACTATHRIEPVATAAGESGASTTTAGGARTRPDARGGRAVSLWLGGTGVAALLAVAGVVLLIRRRARLTARRDASGA
jgi:hypothetical protein